MKNEALRKETQVIDIFEDEEMVNSSSSNEKNREALTAGEAVQTPPQQARQNALLSDIDQSSVQVEIPTRASSTPGRNGEEEWMVRSVRKKRAV